MIKESNSRTLKDKNFCIRYCISLYGPNYIYMQVGCMSYITNNMVNREKIPSFFSLHKLMQVLLYPLCGQGDKRLQKEDS